MINISYHLPFIFCPLCVQGNNTNYYSNTSIIPDGGITGNFGRTYNCLQNGGETIYISGTNFGDNGAIVYVNNLPCSNVIHTIPQMQVSCKLPQSDGDNLNVLIINGQMNGLTDIQPYVSYMIAPPSPIMPNISNIAATSGIK